MNASATLADVGMSGARRPDQQQSIYGKKREIVNVQKETILNLNDNQLNNY